MERVTRYDAGRTGKVVRRDNGWLTIPATIAKVGVQSYRQKDGSVRRELVTSEELFKADSLATLEGVPVTVEHPATATGLLDARTAKTYAVGHVGEKIANDADHVAASVTVHDSVAAAEIEKGRREVSAGYTVGLDFTPGMHPVYGAYDAVQKDRQYNHVAITRAGRAGPTVRLHLDSDGVEIDPAETMRFDSMQKRKINGIDVELSEQAAQLYDAEIERRDSEAATAKARADSEKARADSAETARQAAEDPKRLRAQIDARLTLERKAAPILGAAVKLDSMTDREIMAAVVAKMQPSMADNVKAESDQYVKAAFDFASASYKQGPSQKVAQARADGEAAGEIHADAEDAAKDARQKMIDANRAACKN